MNTQTAFWILVTIGIIEIIGLSAIASSIKSILKSDFFREKMMVANERNKKKSSGDKTSSSVSTLLILFLVLSSWPDALWALSSAESTEVETSFLATKTMVYFVLTIDLVLLMILIYFKNLLSSMLNIDKTKEELAAINEANSINFTQLLTDTIPLDEEYKVETDHEYDGIRELDNNLPPWWKYGFYLSIVCAGIYLVRYHVVKTGDLQIAEYTKTMLEEEENVKAYLISRAMNVDENSAVMIDDPGVLSTGKKLFNQYCKVCHLESGQGATGPNLTDKYWIHGGDIKDLFKTIKYGAQNGMKSWKDELNPIEMQAVASYILTLEEVSKKQGGKEPQGDLYLK